jgi:hypothetical protein
MNLKIVITTINPPSKGILAFKERYPNDLLIIGDAKTPHDDLYIGLNEQIHSLPFSTIKLLPTNHYSRKMIGYIIAAKTGADMIYETDDDNIPNGNWHIPEFNGVHHVPLVDRGFINIYSYFTPEKIWPRGYPLQLVNEYTESLAIRQQVEVGIWQGLADKSPDVDAIYRLTNTDDFYFNNGQPIVLSEGCYCPFNSQNTFFKKEVYPLLYLPAFVSFRFTDILRGYVAQSVMHKHGYRLGFTQATVYQERNYHNIMQDFNQEIDCYQHAFELPEIIEQHLSVGKSMIDNLYSAYLSLMHCGIVPEKELNLLDAWLKDIS